MTCVRSRTCARPSSSPRTGRAAAHPGDIAWWAGWPPLSLGGLAETFLLWEADGEVRGFAACRPEDGDLSVFVVPALPDTGVAADSKTRHSAGLCGTARL